jgi:rhodanese-related sulfurtransferase
LIKSERPAAHTRRVQPQPIPQVTVEQIGADAILLDIREVDEWESGHIDGARHVPMFSLPPLLANDPTQLDRDRPIVVVCAAGSRSAQVTGWLVAQGYDAHNLDGGMYAWLASGRPVITDRASEHGASPVAG